MTAHNFEQERLKKVFAKYFVGQEAKRWDPANRGNHLIGQERLAATQQLLIRHGYWPLDRLHILDIGGGGGGGGELARLQTWGARSSRLHGIDIIPARIEVARKLLPDVDVRVADARMFSLGPASVDLVLLNTAFSLIRDDTIILGHRGPRSENVATRRRDRLVDF